ncbi:hypothetical protein KDK_81410 [Dictyobacter kobayashii]|uniref:Uncharacterized protein n=1 Tax=Dictyobacter kobayashii TaxID=2014872 RepID=A0A402AZ03_9CHLR|nr:hypothetical protein KDK_81410 [Dictyobacter kobayashii]
MVEITKEKNGNFTIFALEKKDGELFYTPSGIMHKSLQRAIERGMSQLAVPAGV